MPQPVTPFSAERILIVDDEATMRTTLSTVLRADGFQTREASTPMEALCVLSEPWSADLLISDIEMPNFSGLDLLQQLGDTHPQLPVIMLSARADIEVALEAIHYGAVDYLTKPFNRTKLIKAIRRALDDTLYRRLTSEFHLLFTPNATGTELRGSNPIKRS